MREQAPQPRQANDCLSLVVIVLFVTAIAVLASALEEGGRMSSEVYVNARISRQ